MFGRRSPDLARLCCSAALRGSNAWYLYTPSSFFCCAASPPGKDGPVSRSPHLPASVVGSLASDMVLTFLGTASCQPTSSRGVSCMALNFSSGNTWLFDVGESSQIQLGKSHIRPSKITKIFITHLHGDHSFGLPGVLCMLGSAAEEMQAKGRGTEDTCIDIYGPEGIRDMIRVALQLSYSRVAIPHRIHEIKGMLQTPQRRVLEGISTTLQTEYGERSGGQDIYPHEDGRYTICDDSSDAKVLAAPMKHTVPCLGFVVEEKISKGSKLQIEKVVNIIQRNKSALELQYSLKSAMKIAETLKRLSPGDQFTFPDGTVVHADDILIPLAARKVVLLGDTSDAMEIAPLAMGANILVHEATNAWFPNDTFNKEHITSNKFSSEHAFNRTVIKRGHSTPQMAGTFAKYIGAKKLVLTHFSSRYEGGSGNESFEEAKYPALSSSISSAGGVMRAIERMAISTSGLTGEGEVVAAQDFLSIPILRN